MAVLTQAQRNQQSAQIAQAAKQRAATAKAPVQYAGPVYPGASESIFRATGKTVFPSSSSSSGGGGSSAQNSQQSSGGGGGGGDGYDALRAQEEAINAQLEADYAQAMSSLASQESGLQGQAGTAISQINNDITAGKTDLSSAQSTQQQGVNTQIQTGERNAKSAMQQARDVFRQTQQANNAQLSALGISSSSVAEALAEKLGVDVARRISGVTGSLDEIRQNATAELGRINKYYTEKTTQLEESGRIQREQIQQALVQGLNQINSARQQAASDKAARRQALLSQVSSSIAALTQQQQQFQQSLQQWATQKASSLTPIAQDPNYIQNLLAKTQQINQQFQSIPGLKDFAATPSFNQNAQGVYTGQIQTQKRPAEDDLLSQYGISG